MACHVSLQHILPTIGYSSKVTPSNRLQFQLLSEIPNRLALPVSKVRLVRTSVVCSCLWTASTAHSEAQSTVCTLDHMMQVSNPGAPYELADLRMISCDDFFPAGGQIRILSLTPLPAN